MSWVVGHNIPYKDGEDFRAIIRHQNTNLNMKDREVILTVGEDCVYYEGSKMSWNWYIVFHKPIKKKKKK